MELWKNLLLLNKNKNSLHAHIHVHVGVVGAQEKIFYILLETGFKGKVMLYTVYKSSYQLRCMRWLKSCKAAVTWRGYFHCLSSPGKSQGTIILSLLEI